jgi:hypothetical protein
MAQSVHSAGNELDDREIVFRFPASIRSFLLRIPHSSWGIHPTFYALNVYGPSSNAKQPAAWYWPASPSNAEVWRIHGDVPPTQYVFLVYTKKTLPFLSTRSQAHVFITQQYWRTVASRNQHYFIHLFLFTFPNFILNCTYLFKNIAVSLRLRYNFATFVFHSTFNIPAKVESLPH